MAMLDNPITKNAGDAFFGDDTVVPDFKGDRLLAGDEAYKCLGYFYKKEDATELLDHLIDVLGAEAVLGELGAEQVNWENKK